jgi:putative glutamine amidotransferase
VKPLIAITPDIMTVNGVERFVAGTAYAEAVERAGGTPVIVPARAEAAAETAARFDAFVLTGGDDPRTEPFGASTHPKATPVRQQRQAFETELLRGLEADHPKKPVLGVCLGMQMMALVAGGELDQHMPETTPTHADHWEADHDVEPAAGGACVALAEPLAGVVRSKHRQAVRDPASLEVFAHAPDGVIEAVADPGRRFYVGVQWHPERTAGRRCGRALFEGLIASVRP